VDGRLVASVVAGRLWLTVVVADCHWQVSLASSRGKRHPWDGCDIAAAASGVDRPGGSGRKAITNKQ